MKMFLKDQRFYIKRFVMNIGILLLSLLANLIIKIAPFKTIMKRFTTDDQRPAAQPTEHQQKLLRLFLESVEGISDRVPWRMKCFESALVMLFFAKMIGAEIEVNFGIQKKDDIVSAHAWTAVIGMELTGRHEKKDYTCVYTRCYRPKNINKV